MFQGDTLRNSHIRQNAAKQAYNTILAICSMDNPSLVLLKIIVLYVHNIMINTYYTLFLILCDHFAISSMHLLCLI